MRSIRLSLMVCFLGLLAAAMLSASLLVYRNAEQTLEAKRQAMEQLLQTRYQERCREKEKQLDDDLLAQARSLAQLVQVQFKHYRSDLVQPALLLGLLSSNLSNNGHVLAATWLAEGVPPPRPEPPFRFGPPSVYGEFRRHLPMGSKQLKVDDLLLPSDGYFQIDSPPTKSYYSPSMAGHSFPLDDSVFDADQMFHWVFDNPKLETNVPLRRVVLKASGVASRWPRRSRERPPRPNGAPPRPSVHRGPTIYVHCAARTDKRDAALAGFRQQRDEELADVLTQSQASLRDLRMRLLAISLIVFAVTGVGGFWLVPLGLAPLRRLGDAVSRVSAKDFRLPLDGRPLPSELRPIAERLTHTLDLLKRAFAREKQAAADISHELRTPLAVLLTTTEFGLRKPRSLEHYRELLNDCHASAQQMNQIVERLLTLARLDAGVDRLRPQFIDAAALAQQCASVIRPLAEAHGLHLTVCSSEVASGEWRVTSKEEGLSSSLATRHSPLTTMVHIDPDKLREIVSNLLHNAIQYNRPGGSIDLRVARVNGSLEVEVRDSGIGIAPAAREHIFERFYRADPSRQGDELHSGLGLAIVKEYIDLMGGTIGVDSCEGKGSTFRIVLPAN